jgi:sialate O-acetylesterase
MKKIRIQSVMQARNVFLLSVLVFLFSNTLYADVTLPYVLSDNMVLQRDVPVNIWGWATPGEKVTVSINGQKVSAKAIKSGEWMVQLKPLVAGGPYEMKQHRSQKYSGR